MTGERDAEFFRFPRDAEVGGPGDPGIGLDEIRATGSVLPSRKRVNRPHPVFLGHDVSDETRSVYRSVYPSSYD